MALSNTEMRRVLAERLGWSRYLEKLDAERVGDEWRDPQTGLRYELYDCAELGVRILRKESPELMTGEKPWYCEPVHRELATPQAARKWQPLVGLGGDARSVALDCNRNPQLTYQVEA